MQVGGGGGGGGITNPTFQTALEELQDVILAFQASVDDGVPLLSGDIEALQQVTATVLGMPSDYPDAAAQTKLEDLKTKIDAVNAALTDILGEIGDNGTLLSGIQSALAGTLEVDTNLTDFPSTTANTHLSNILTALAATLNVAGSVSMSNTSTLATAIVNAAHSNVGAQTAVATSTTNVQIVGNNTNRKQVTIHNGGTTDLYVKYGTTATTSDYTLVLPPGATLFEDCYTGRIDGILASGTGSAKVSHQT